MLHITKLVATYAICVGPRLVGRLRPDLQRKFSTLIEEETAIFDYIYHCNAQRPR